MAGEKKKIEKNVLKEVLSAYSKTIKIFRKGDYEKASDALKVFLKEFPSDRELTARARTYLAICDHRLKKELTTPKSFEDYYQLAVFKMNQGEYEESLKALNKAREKKPKEGKIHYLIANVYCLMEEETKCLENLKKAVQRDRFFGILAQNESDFEPFAENKKFKLITNLK